MADPDTISVGTDFTLDPDAFVWNQGSAANQGLYVAFFRKELLRKLELQWAGQYRYLWARKATKELRRFLGRYVEWFLVRVVKIKSLLGRRKEVSKETISILR